MRTIFSCAAFLGLFLISNHAGAVVSLICDPRSPVGTICYDAASPKECDTSKYALGTSLMDGDKQNVIVCLLNTSNGKYYWKAMTAANAAPTVPVNTPTVYYCPYGNTNNNTCAATCNHQAGTGSTTCVTWYQTMVNGALTGVCGSVSCQNTQ